MSLCEDIIASASYENFSLIPPEKWEKRRHSQGCSHCGDELKSSSLKNCHFCGYLRCKKCISKYYIPSMKFPFSLAISTDSFVANTATLSNSFSKSRKDSFKLWCCHGCFHNLERSFLQKNPKSPPRRICYVEEVDSQGNIRILYDKLNLNKKKRKEFKKLDKDPCYSCGKSRHVMLSRYRCAACIEPLCANCVNKMDLWTSFMESHIVNEGVGRPNATPLCNECRFEIIGGASLNHANLTITATDKLTTEQLHRRISQLEKFHPEWLKFFREENEDYVLKIDESRSKLPWHLGTRSPNPPPLTNFSSHLINCEFSRRLSEISFTDSIKTYPSVSIETGCSIQGLTEDEEQSRSLITYWTNDEKLLPDNSAEELCLEKLPCPEPHVDSEFEEILVQVVEVDNIEKISLNAASGGQDCKFLEIQPAVNTSSSIQERSGTNFKCKESKQKYSKLVTHLTPSRIN